MIRVVLSLFLLTSAAADAGVTFTKKGAFARPDFATRNLDRVITYNATQLEAYLTGKGHLGNRPPASVPCPPLVGPDQPPSSCGKSRMWIVDDCVDATCTTGTGSTGAIQCLTWTDDVTGAAWVVGPCSGTSTGGGGGGGSGNWTTPGSTTSGHFVTYANSNGTTAGESVCFEVGGIILGCSLGGNAATSTALAVDGTNCTGGQLATGVDASGNAQGCTSNAPTASALATNPPDCSGGQVAAGIAADGTAAGCTSNIPGNAATATALASNGSNCTGGAVAIGVDASGNSEGCTSNVPSATQLLLNGSNCNTGTEAATGVDAAGVAEGCWQPFRGVGGAPQAGALVVYGDTSGKAGAVYNWNALCSGVGDPDDCCAGAGIGTCIANLDPTTGALFARSFSAPAHKNTPSCDDYFEQTTNGTNKITVCGQANVAADYQVDLPNAAGRLVGVSSTDTLTNKTLNAESTGNLLTTFEKRWLRAALCNNATASTLWDLPTSSPAVPACATGSNTQGATLDFATTGLSAQWTDYLPSDWAAGTSIDATVLWNSSVTSGNVTWSAALACVPSGSTQPPGTDASFNTATTATGATAGTAGAITVTPLPGLTQTSCAVSSLLHLKVSRAASGDTLSGTVRLVGVNLTFRRAQSAANSSVGTTSTTSSSTVVTTSSSTSSTSSTTSTTVSGVGSAPADVRSQLLVSYELDETGTANRVNNASTTCGAGAGGSGCDLVPNATTPNDTVNFISGTASASFDKPSNQTFQCSNVTSGRCTAFNIHSTAGTGGDIAAWGWMWPINQGHCNAGAGDCITQPFGVNCPCTSGAQCTGGTCNQQNMMLYTDSGTNTGVNIQRGAFGFTTNALSVAINNGVQQKHCASGCGANAGNNCTVAADCQPCTPSQFTCQVDSVTAQSAVGIPTGKFTFIGFRFNDTSNVIDPFVAGVPSNHDCRPGSGGGGDSDCGGKVGSCLLTGGDAGKCTQDSLGQVTTSFTDAQISSSNGISAVDGKVDLYEMFAGRPTDAWYCRFCSVLSSGAIGWCDNSDATQYKICTSDADCNGRVGSCDTTASPHRCQGRNHSDCSGCTLPACNATTIATVP